MLLLKFFVKALMLPVILILYVLRVLVKIGIEISSVAVGGLMLTIFGCIIYTIVQHAWSSMMVLIVMEIGLIIFTFVVGVFEAFLEIIGESVGSFIKK